MPKTPRNNFSSSSQEEREKNKTNPNRKVNRAKTKLKKF